VVQEGMVTERLEVFVKAKNIVAGKEISLWLNNESQWVLEYTTTT